VTPIWQRKECRRSWEGRKWKKKKRVKSLALVGIKKKLVSTAHKGRTRRSNERKKGTFEEKRRSRGRKKERCPYGSGEYWFADGRNIRKKEGTLRKPMSKPAFDTPKGWSDFLGKGLWKEKEGGTAPVPNQGEKRPAAFEGLFKKERQRTTHLRASRKKEKSRKLHPS